MLISIHKYDSEYNYTSSEEFNISNMGMSVPMNCTTASPHPIPANKVAKYSVLSNMWEYVDPPFVVLPVTNIVITAATLVGDIWWVEVNTPWTITANISLPDVDMMIVLERIVDGVSAIDDVRFVASVVSGGITINGMFSQSGNYSISAERLNKGLKRIGENFRLTFDAVEFDAHINVP